MAVLSCWRRDLLVAMRSAIMERSAAVALAKLAKASAVSVVKSVLALLAVGWEWYPVSCPVV